MKEYRFLYTKNLEILITVLSSMMTFILAEVIFLYYKLNPFFAVILSFGLAYILFQILKRKVVHTGHAQLDRTSVEFVLENGVKKINFSDLISFKLYNGKNGPVLYLKSKNDTFKLFANNNFCEIDDLKVFCKDAIRTLEKYKIETNPSLVREGSIFAKRGILYFYLYLLSCI
jgi:hypothetical protein